MRTPQEIASAFAPRDSLSSYASFYLVGIGGAGMSGIAQMLQRRGLSVRGSDSTPSPSTAELEALGISVRIGHSGEGVRAEDAVVLSDAIDLAESPEVQRAKALGCKLFRRSQVLGWLLRGKKVIAVTGTHGKTTTTGMIGAGLRAAGADPTIVVGAVVPEFGGAVVEGLGDWAVIEACEAYDSFHDLDPAMVVLTNLEPDHLDFHGTFDNLRASVLRFVGKLPEGGWLVSNSEDEGCRDIAASVEDPSRVDAFSLESYRSRSAGNRIDRLAVPGEHNERNAAAALVAIKHTGAPLALAAAGVAKFGGAERRLQVLLEGDWIVVDDYAHHPAEVEASLLALKGRYPDRRLICVFQPHLYSRTAEFLAEFAAKLSISDHVVLTDIYPAREAPMAGISSARIAELVTVPCTYVPSRHLLPREVAELAKKGDVVVGMGAGNISEFAPAFIKELDRAASTVATTSPGGRAGHRIAVIYGGDSAEREVSLHSGIAVQEALARQGYDARLCDVTELLLSRGDVSGFIGFHRPDVAFLAVHGTHAEDGAIQGFLELLHIPHTGSGLQASALAMDKRITKQILAAEGVKVPRGMLVRSASDPGLSGFLATGVSKWIVKPNAQGSTVGLSFVESANDLEPAIMKALQYDDAALVEDWIEGRELSVPVLGDRALPVVEIVPVGGRYDFAAKYLPGATEEVVPAHISASETEEAQSIALRSHQALGCSGATRTDMILTQSGDIYALEVNTLPGMTKTSLLPNSAAAAGISFDELCHWIVQDVWERHGSKA